MARGKKPKIDVSRGKFKCKVPSCQTELRSDHVKEHYEKRVLFDKMNRIEEIEESGKFSALELQTHTSYFKEMGWINESMIPSYKSHEIAMSKGSQSIDRFFVKPPSSVNEDSNGDVEAREDGNEVVSKTTADWLAELELSKVKKAGSFLDGCKVFLSGFSEPEQMQLARVLEYSGGVRLTKLVESVTHCVHSVGTNTVVPDTSKLLEQLDLSPHMVSIQWMVESMLLGKPVQEADFPFPPQLEAEKETILPPQDTQLQASYEQKTAEADQSHFMANLLAGGVGYSGLVSLNPAAEYDDEPDINQNILRTKRRIGEVDSSSEDEEEDEPEAFALENMDVEVTPPSSHNSSFQEDSQGAPFLKEVADASIANLEATEGGNLLNPDNVGQVVKRELLNALSGVGEYKEIFAETLTKISKTIAEKVKEKSAEDDAVEKLNTLEDYWYGGENFMSCQPCVKYKNNENVPAAIKSDKKGNFGFVTKDQLKRKMMRSILKHEKSDLHKWCVLEAEKELKEKMDERERNVKIGEKIVRNVIFCVKKGMSPRDFIGLNEKDGLAELDIATKNDSRKEFKRIRGYVKDEIDNKIKEIIKSCDKISITLDKVTVARHSYMVYITFFFYEGKIHSYLNEIRKMNVEDYDSEGTARMTIEVMMRTLGISEARFSRLIKHFSYDGVFADKEERVSGGGCLQLRKNMEEQLGKDEGDLQGDWEPAHKLEIIFHKVLVYNKYVEANINLYSSIQKEYKVGKKSSQFSDIASECCFLTLKNKVLQKTRFVRSWLRVMTTGLVNTPTFVALFSKEMREALYNNNNTEAKRLEKMIKNLTSPRNILLALGLCQILDLYSRCSVLVQRSDCFPVTTWQEIRALQLSIDMLAQQWQWKESNLVFGEVGNPAGHIRRIKEEGKYIPFVKQKYVRMNRKMLEEQHDVEGFLSRNEDDEDSDEEDVEEMAGSVPVEGFTEVVLADVEKILSKLSKDLSVKMKEMLVQSTYQKKVTDAFGAIHRFDLDEADIQRAFGMLEELVDSFPACDRDAFDIRAALPGFIHWDKYQSQHRLNSKGKIISIEENWVDFVKLSNTEGRNEFKKLFEYCMVDVMSEAMAENVGSVMTHHLGSGSRNTLLPVNLNCEISIRCNLGPLHMLESVVKSVVMRRIDEDQVLYKRALDGKRPYMLKALVNTSSSIHTYREEEKKKAHLPLSIW